MSFFIDTEPKADGGRGGGSEPLAPDSRRKRRQEQRGDGEECRILFRAVSAGALGDAVAETQANGEGEEAKPKPKRARFSRQAMSSRFFDSGRVHDESAGGFGQGRFKAGDVSDGLRAACGIGRHQLPPWIYRMRQLGYPPGWLAEARHQHSGIAIIDDSGVSASESPSPVKYDVEKLVEFPGFNCPLPPGAVDEHRRLGCPPMQLQHHLSAFVQRLRSENLAQDGDAYHTRRIRQARSRDNEQQQLDMELESSEDEADLQELEARRRELLHQLEAGELEEVDSCGGSESGDQREASPQESRAVGSEFGSPVFSTYSARLPDAAKFNRNIEEFKPFENLPNSTGSFKKVNAVVQKIRKFLPKIS